MIKVTYIISQIKQAPLFETVFNLMDKNKFEVAVILLNPGISNLEEVLLAQNIYCKRIDFAGKKDYVRALYKCFKLLRRLKPDFVHAHLIDAGLIGLTAALLSGVKYRIYTSHGGSQKIYFEKGIKYDKTIKRLATHFVATCENVKQILTDELNVSPEKITIINYAFNIDRFAHPDVACVENLKLKYNPYNRGPVIGVISRWVEWKGIQYILPAYRELLTTHPNALLILANATGNYTPELEKQLRTFRPEEITLITFEKKFHELYQLFDIFIHVPVEKRFEAFGQIYIEALAAGIPSIFTLAGIAPEIIKHTYNAEVVDFKNSKQIAEALNNLCTDAVRRGKLILNGKKSVQGRFEFSRYLQEEEMLYSRLYKKEK